MNAQIKPTQVPVLTEVVEWTPRPSESVQANSRKPSLQLTPLAEPDVPVEAWLAVAETQITQQVLSDVQRQVDRMFEFRLKESLGPAMSRLADQFVEEMRGELAATLRDIVRRAVAQELARLRNS